MKHSSSWIAGFAFAIAAGILLAASAQAQSKLNYSGLHTAWAQSQHAFTFDKDIYKDNYFVQMFRMNLAFAVSDNVKAVTRFDIAQGWWGVDNERRSVERTNTGGGSALFDFKDTNFQVHVDQAYIDFKIPKTPLQFRVGRMWYGVGNKIMMDNNYDGLQVDLVDVVGKKLTASYAKVSEGHDSLTDREQVAADPWGNSDARDADLFSLNFHNQAGKLTYDVFGFYYDDKSISDGNAYLPDHLQYFKARFSPQVTKLWAFGLNARYQTGKLNLLGEFNYLTGEDEIANTVFGAQQKWDINNGDLRGYNLYLKGDYQIVPKFRLGGVFGLGSGDDDPTSGKGNVNKLRTAGFFYITEIWEDSIMPDEEGITPQGLGAPNVRGYRELENTTALQVNALYKPVSNWDFFASYTYLKATEGISPWVANAETGAVINRAISATDLGSEIDFRISWTIVKNLSTHLRGGWFFPGDAAAYLIRGNNAKMDTAWELKGEVTLAF